MKMSESITNISVALCKFQQECPAPKKNATNPHFKNKYAALDEIISTITPVLTKYGLSQIQSTTSEGENIGVKTLLIHESGEFIEFDTLWLPMGKVNAQGAGSSVTYARRYALCASLGIAAEEDDDGNNASQNNGSGQSSSQGSNPSLASEKQLKLVENLLKKKVNGEWTFEKLHQHLKTQVGTEKNMENWSKSEASKAIEILQGAAS